MYIASYNLLNMDRVISKVEVRKRSWGWYQPLMIHWSFLLGYVFRP